MLAVYDLTHRETAHRRADFDRGQVVWRVIRPAAHRGIDGPVGHPDQELAVGKGGDRRVLHREMLGLRHALGAGGEDDAAVGGHGVGLSIVTVPDVIRDLYADARGPGSCPGRLVSLQHVLKPAVHPDLGDGGAVGQTERVGDRLGDVFGVDLEGAVRGRNVFDHAGVDEAGADRGGAHARRPAILADRVGQGVGGEF